MSSSSFGEATLRLLHEQSFCSISYVYTKPPSRSGRGKALKKNHIHSLADDLGIEVCCFQSLKDVEIPRGQYVLVVVSYGIIIPQRILSSAIYALNIHPSLLPRWRGAAPIQHALLNGDKKTAVCIIEVVKEVDAGDIFVQELVDIDLINDNYLILLDKLSNIGARLMVNVLKDIDNIVPVPQSDKGLLYADKIPKYELSFIEHTAFFIDRYVKAMMGAFIKINDITVKLIYTEYICNDSSYESGKIINHFNDELIVATSKDLLKIIKLQLPGKYPITGKDFINSYLK